MIIAIIMSLIGESIITSIYAFLFIISVRLYRHKVVGSNMMLVGSSLGLLMMLLKLLSIVVMMHIQQTNYIMTSLGVDFLLNAAWILCFSLGFYQFSKLAIQNHSR